jgi:hypothetical protein
LRDAINFAPPAKSGEEQTAMRTAQELYDETPKSDATTTEPKREVSEPVVEQAAVEPKPSETPAETKPTQPVAAAVEKTDDDSEQEHVPGDLEGLKKALAAARGDKRKARKQWQETERKLAELEGKISVYQQGAQPKADEPPKPAVPDLDDLTLFDPKALKSFIEYQVKSGVSTVEAKQFARGRALAKDRHPDFDEFEAEFIKAVEKNPTLGDNADNSPDPAEYAYKMGKQLREMQGINSIDDLREKIRAEERAKIQAELTQAQPAAPQVSGILQIPKSLASIRGTGVGVKPEWRPHTAEQLYDQR